ncbi:hypothetical protein STEG23_017931, partial [Scotinomys teguina]
VPALIKMLKIQRIPAAKRLAKGLSKEQSTHTSPERECKSQGTLLLNKGVYLITVEFEVQAMHLMIPDAPNYT